MVGLVKKSYDSLAWTDGGSHLEQYVSNNIFIPTSLSNRESPPDKTTPFLN